MKIAENVFRLIARSIVKIIKENPIHQIPGLPIATIIDIKSKGKCNRKSKTGFIIKGQVHHFEAKG